jgi:hypothetical protein
MRAAWVAGVLFGVVVAGPATGAPAASAASGAPGEATVDDVATAIAADGWYADGDAVGDREQLDHVAERLGQGGDPMGFALLAAEPAGSSTAFAEQVLDALPAHGEYAIDTVVVLSDADVGVVSDAWSDGAIDGALDDTIDDLRADPTDGLEALSAALADQPSGFDGSSFDDDDADGSDGGGGSNAGGLIALGLVALVALSVGSRYLSGEAAFDGDGDGDDGGSSSSSSSWSRRRRRSFSSSSRRRGSSSSRSRSSRRSSSSSSHRGRGGRRL